MGNLDSPSWKEPGQVLKFGSSGASVSGYAGESCHGGKKGFRLLYDLRIAQAEIAGLHFQRTQFLRIWHKRTVFFLCIGLAFTLTAGVAGTMLLARQWFRTTTADRIYSDIDRIPKNKVGLVLGCSPRVRDGSGNVFFWERVKAARDLFSRGKVDYLLVSGDNHKKTYDEPTEMKQALIKLGVPEDRIYCDYAGFRTLDSIVRAKKVFQQDRLTVISQPFHNQRAVFIGLRKGIDIVGYNAQGPSRHASLPTVCREQLARVKTVLDLYLLTRGPKFLGPPVRIGDAS